MLRTDPNPMLDDGEPTSTGGIIDAARLCDALSLQLRLGEPREH